MDVESPDAFSRLLPGLHNGVRADEDAFFHLVGPKLMAWSKTKFFIAENLREDFAIEVIEKALSKITLYHSSKGSFLTWLFVLARNHAADQGRKLRDGRDVLHGALSEDTLEWEDLQLPCLPSLSEPEGETDRRPILKALDAALAALPFEDQRILDLIYSGMPAPEVAEICHKSPDNVRQRHRRLLKKLCGILSQVS